jgi:hypothetical protein
LADVINHAFAALPTDSALQRHLSSHAARPGSLMEFRARDGANLTRASAGQDSRTGEWVVHFALDRVGAKRFADVGTRYVGEPFAIVLDGNVISAPVIREPISARAQRCGQTARVACTERPGAASSDGRAGLKRRIRLALSGLVPANRDARGHDGPNNDARPLFDKLPLPEQATTTVIPAPD